MQHAGRVELICGATQEPPGALKDGLRAAGYRITQISELDARTAAPDCLAVVYVDAESRTRMLRTLCRDCRYAGMLVVSERIQALEALSPCTDFVLWPCSADELRLRMHRLSRLDAQRRCTAGPREFEALGLLGQSPSFLACLRMLRLLAQNGPPVLIQGETGTGKELAARALHYLGPRRNQPFIPVNCGALPDALMENELFGHDRGAFTDARSVYKGLVAQAGSGTLFLDEIDSLSWKAQTALLRFLQDFRYQPLGSGKLLDSGVTVLAATNCHLPDKVATGAFRQDLLFRLNVTTVELPPLRARGHDIVLLAEHFLRRYCERYGLPPRALHPASANWLEAYAWPGNVRELDNVIHREVLLSETPVVRIDPARHAAQCIALGAPQPADVSLDDGFREGRERAIRDFERSYLHRLMQQTQGNVSQAARLAGKERRCLGRLLKKHGLNREAYLAGVCGDD